MVDSRPALPSLQQRLPFTRASLRLADFPTPSSTHVGEEVASVSLLCAVVLLCATLLQRVTLDRRESGKPRATVANPLEPPWVYVLILIGMFVYHKPDYPDDYYAQWEFSASATAGGEGGSKHRDYKFAGWAMKFLVFMTVWQAGGRYVWNVLSGQKQDGLLAWYPSSMAPIGVLAMALVAVLWLKDIPLGYYGTFVLVVVLGMIALSYGSTLQGALLLALLLLLLWALSMDSRRAPAPQAKRAHHRTSLTSGKALPV